MLIIGMKIIKTKKKDFPEAVKNYEKDGKSEFYCTRCSGNDQYYDEEKKIIRAADTLFFLFDSKDEAKANLKIKIPEEFVVKPKSLDPITYKVFAIINHIGTAEGGHYYTYANFNDM